MGREKTGGIAQRTNIDYHNSYVPFGIYSKGVGDTQHTSKIIRFRRDRLIADYCMVQTAKRGMCSDAVFEPPLQGAVLRAQATSTACLCD